MPTPSIQKSKRVTRLDKKKESEWKEKMNSELEEWKEMMKERIDDYFPNYDAMLDRIYFDSYYEAKELNESRPNYE